MKSSMELAHAQYERGEADWSAPLERALEQPLTLAEAQKRLEKPPGPSATGWPSASISSTGVRAWRGPSPL